MSGKKTKKKTNLITEIERFGYKVSVISIVFTFLGVVAGCFAAGYLFQLKLVGYLIVSFVAAACTFSIIYQTYKAKYEQKRFSDASLYLEKMVYYFSSSKKILDSLQTTLKLFPTGKMHNVLEKAINEILTSTSYNVERVALDIIEESYATTRIKTLHEFMIDVEYNGGNIELGKEILLNDRKNWVDRTMEMQQGKKYLKRDTVYGLGMVTLMALGVLYLPKYVPNMNLDIIRNSFVQITSIILLCFNIIIYTKVNSFMSKNWLENKDQLSDEECEEKYNHYINYNVHKDITIAIICSVVTIILGTTVYVFTRSFLCFIVSGCLIIFFIMSPKIAQSENKKILERMLGIYYPAWLLKVSLYLQTENVAMAITKSYESAPGIIKPGLKKMLLELNEKPDSVEPYNNFLKEFSITEINESMTALYSLSQSSGGNIEEEFKELIKRNDELTNTAEIYANKDKVENMKLFTYLPGVICGIKMVCDFTVLFITFIMSASQMS